jgi:tetratricopeptide (TPR) repeat protein
LEGDDLEKCLDLQATTFLNMATIFYLEKNYPKTIEKATLSLNMKPTIKGYFRRAQAYAAKNQFEDAIKDLESGIKLDPSDPNDLQQELLKYKNHHKDQEKKRIQGMQGFLYKDKKEE